MIIRPNLIADRIEVTFQLVVCLSEKFFRKMKLKTDNYYWYFLAILVMAFYFVQGTGYLDELGMADALSWALFSVALIVGSSFFGKITTTITASTIVVFNLLLSIGSYFYFDLYQSYVPFSILYLAPDAGALISSFSVLYPIFGIVATVGIAALFWSVVTFVKSPSTLSLGLTFVLLIICSLSLQLYHDSREGKQFQKFSEVPIGYFFRTGGFVPFIDGNPLADRMANIDAVANSIVEGRSKKIPIAYRKAIAKFYPKQVTNDELYPMRKEAINPFGEHDATATEKLANRKNVIVIVLESFRAAESGAYGSQESVSPFIDSLAKKSLFAEKAYSTAPLTIKSETAINCGIFDSFGGQPKSRRGGVLKATCVPEILRDKGYQTYWFHGNSQTVYNREVYMPLLGFEKIVAFEELYGDKSLLASIKREKRHGTKEKPLLGWGIPDPVVYSMALDRLEKSDKPFYAEILTVSNHLPFDWDWGIKFPTELQKSDTFYENYKRGMYYSDVALESFFTQFRKSNLYDNTVVVVTGDHGIWTFDDEQKLTELNKHEQFFRVPLLIFSKDLNPRVVTEPTSHVDIPPTILSLLNVDADTVFFGRSLVDESERIVPIYSLFEASYSFRLGDNICLPRNRCFRNGPECTDYKEAALKKSVMACYVDQGEMMFDKHLEAVSLPEQTQIFIDDFLNYSMLGLQIGFTPEKQLEVKTPSTRAK